MTLPRTPEPGDEIALMLEAFNHALKTGSGAAMDVAMQLADDNRTRAMDANNPFVQSAPEPTMRNRHVTSISK